MICLIGGTVIRNERTARETAACRQTCLEIEDWLEQFTRSCDAVNLLISEDQREALGEADNAKHLQRLLNELPENKVKEFSERLIQHHIKLFGEMRKIGEGQKTHYWMLNPFLLAFGTHVTHLYIKLKTLNIHLADYQNQPKAENRESLILSAKCAYAFSLHNAARDQANPQVVAINNEVGNDLHGDNLGDKRPPQAPEEFASIMEEAEYWRKNICRLPFLALRLNEPEGLAAIRALQAHSTSLLLHMNFAKINKHSINFLYILTIF